ncbi:hypothetical protein [Dyella sp.]|uniref:hypothetical protein n=1 Tax=Dyella sp. TaxID=1869338 RepID=UPI002ED67E20
MSHGDPQNPQRNPQPSKRYEVTATVDASGAWDSVNGRVFFDVTNVECTPKDEFLGIHKKPKDVVIDFTMTRVDDKTWKGYFYRDAVRDEDYYGLGVCHWDASNVGAVFVARKVTFASTETFDDLLHKGSQTNYFNRHFRDDPSPTLDNVPGLSAVNPQVMQQPDAFFPITVSVKEATP